MPAYYLIVNPKSGYKKGLSILKQVEGEFKDTNIELSIKVSEYKNHPYDLAKSISFEGYDGLCVIGGDGTMHEVINGMMDRPDNRRLPIGLIPAGTGNSLMHDLDCVKPQKAIDNIKSHKLRKLDLFEIEANGKSLYGFNILGWGVPVDINTLAEKMRWLRGQRYNVASLIEVMKNRARKVKIIIDDETIEGRYSIFLACNTMYTGNGMKMAPQAKMDDGYIDILIAKKVSRIKLLRLFAKVFSGKHMRDPVINWYRAKEFSVITDDNQKLNIDGQPTGHTPIHARMLTEKLDIFG